MEIKHDEKGRILSCSKLKNVERGRQIIELSENDLPEDFLAKFALGKYLVKRRKIVKNPEFIPPEPVKSDLFGFLDKPEAKVKANKSKKRTKKKKQSNRNK